MPSSLASIHYALNGVCTRYTRSASGALPRVRYLGRDGNGDFVAVKSMFGLYSTSHCLLAYSRVNSEQLAHSAKADKWEMCMFVCQ